MQRDNDPKHGPNIPTQQSTLEKQKWKVLGWPTHSAELNPFEHADMPKKARQNLIHICTSA